MPTGYPSDGVKTLSYLLIYINPLFDYLSIRLATYQLTNWVRAPSR